MWSPTSCGGPSSTVPGGLRGAIWQWDVTTTSRRCLVVCVDTGRDVAVVTAEFVLESWRLLWRHSTPVWTALRVLARAIPVVTEVLGDKTSYCQHGPLTTAPALCRTLPRAVCRTSLHVGRYRVKTDNKPTTAGARVTIDPVIFIPVSKSLS